ncbi:hypothetical protein SLA2020_443390 [Shorea laevis]
MGRLRAKSDYEDLRKARILENQARLASLGLHKTLSDVRSLAPVAKSQKTPVRKYDKKAYGITPLRRSDRLKRMTADSIPTNNSLRHSNRLRDKSREDGVEEKDNHSSGRRAKKSPANMPLVKIEGRDARDQLSPEDSARRCSSKARGTVHNSFYGICCHFCRQKTLCAEEDCKRCGNLDLDQPCIGKTDCSVCHSSNGVLCRACLKVRYGEELEEVRNNKGWMCPHCIEEKGTNPYWICNSSFCLKNRKMAPTGIAIFRARELGYKSVAHLLMDELQRGEKLRS